jgi:hypothetical protein
MRKYVASYRIQQYWNKVTTDTHFRIELNKVNRDYDKLFTEDGRVKCY